MVQVHGSYFRYIDSDTRHNLGTGDLVQVLGSWNVFKAQGFRCKAQFRYTGLDSGTWTIFQAQEFRYKA
jgi:hypothetical protein